MSVTPEKQKLDEQHFEHVDSPTRDGVSPAHTDAADDDSMGLTVEERRRIMRRIDLRLVVTVGAMYCVSLMDRTNMSAANLAGMGVELQLTGFRYVSVSGVSSNDSWDGLSGPIGEVWLTD
jgi:hypothetical protein